MTDGTITRPETEFDGDSHTYDVPGWKGRTMGVSSVAKIGEAEDSFSIGSAWGFRIGYEGARDLDLISNLEAMTYEEVRAELQARGLTPWGTRDRAAKRGNWAHDLLEALANDRDNVDAIVEAMDKVDEEHQGHAKGILNWFIDYRPSFVATEVQVSSVDYGFAGRYDIRCWIPARLLLEKIRHIPERLRGYLQTPARLNAAVLCLVDLKTSKRIYRTSHFVQLEGYEGASVEMGFPETLARIVLNTHPDGTYDFEASYATYDDFLAYLEALRAIRRLKALDPEVRAKREREEQLLALLPALSRDIAGRDGLPETAKEVGGILGKLRKRGLCEQRPDKTWVRTADAAGPEDSTPPEGGEVH